MPFVDMSNLQPHMKYNNFNKNNQKFQNKNWHHRNNANVQPENRNYSASKDTFQSNNNQNFNVDFDSISKNILSSLEDKSMSTFMTENPVKKLFPYKPNNYTGYKNYTSFNTPLLTPQCERIVTEKKSQEKKYPKLINKNYIIDQTINFVDQYNFEKPCYDMKFNKKSK